MLPQSAGKYRDMVKQLRSTRELLADFEYVDVRACVFETLAGRVLVRPRASIEGC
jgi:hypothetical protein